MKFIKPFVKDILVNALKYDWSIQGFGMLRLYLPDDVRLNIWNDHFRVPNVSLIHTHPWDFESLIVSGTLKNIRLALHDDGIEFKRSLIKPGPKGGLLGEAELLRLIPLRPEVYKSGEIYSQRAMEIHMSLPENGTITLNLRQRKEEDIAYVFWEANNNWVSAEPRRATKAEIAAFAASANYILEKEESALENGTPVIPCQCCRDHGCSDGCSCKQIGDL